jgi:hypothetical protein
LPVFAYNLAHALPYLCRRQEATMGVIELMAIGNPVPDMTLTMGSAVEIALPMLAVLGVAAFGIWRAIPSRSRVPALQLVLAEGR